MEVCWEDDMKEVGKRGGEWKMESVGVNSDPSLSNIYKDMFAVVMKHKEVYGLAFPPKVCEIQTSA